MIAGEVIGNNSYDTLHFTDSLFPVVRIDAGNRQEHWLIDTALPCLYTEITHADTRMSLINAAGDTLAEEFGSLPPLRIGKRIFHKTGGGLLTRAAQKRLQDSNIQGVIGANLMQHSVWHFDFAHQRVIVAPSSEKFIDSQAVALSFNRNIYRSPKWQVQFNRFPYRLVIQASTGFAGGILLDAEFSDNYKSFMYDRDLQALLFPDMMHGAASGQGLLMDSLLVEKQQTFERVPVTRSNSSYGLLGLACLRRYNFTVDWQQRTIWLHPI